ncbi:MAG TPA: right-handed parallel beta-helix repeat-containing protein [Chitinispirillaceae bacterium]|nr:right-handed parallel beta-helix repeat-containing protein [Chitinispirillaceae bacterium]
MCNKSIRYRSLYGIVIAGIAASLQAATITVSKGGTAIYNTIQSAVDAAVENDTIIIKDSNIYEECVTLKSKRNIVLMSDPALVTKPSITYTDKLNVGPKNCSEAQDTANITFFKNGALRIMESANIVVKDISINGKEIYPFGYPAVWSDLESCRWPMQSGNTAIVLFQSCNVIIDGCDIANAFYGIYIDGFVRTSSGSIDLLSTSPMEAAIGYTGNNLIENNRIHHNTYGLFLENESDFSTVIRQNLFYENHHQTDAAAELVKTLTSEGLNLPGGAIYFKNSQKTPLAIYNNTFYNNFLLLVAGWRPGSHYLIFNNLYAKPFRYWSDDRLFANSFLAADPVYVNRTFSCLFACQTTALKTAKKIITRYDNQNDQTVILDTITSFLPRIMNQMDQIENTDLHLYYGDFDTVLANEKLPGNKILSSAEKPFPSGANVRWLEPIFKSTDPSSNDFLIPDWNDSLMNRFVVDQGWAASGVRDADGSIADIGAIPSNRNANSTRARILPVNYITENSPEQISFILDSDSPLSDCRIEYCKLINNTNRDTNSLGGIILPLTLSNVHDVTTTGEITTGFNQINCEIKNKNQSLKCGFFELIISGVNSQGIRVSSTPGFLPVSVSEMSDFDVTFNDLDSQSASNDQDSKKNYHQI